MDHLLIAAAIAWTTACLLTGYHAGRRDSRRHTTPADVDRYVRDLTSQAAPATEASLPRLREVNPIFAREESRVRAADAHAAALRAAAEGFYASEKDN